MYMYASIYLFKFHIITLDMSRNVGVLLDTKLVKVEEGSQQAVSAPDYPGLARSKWPIKKYRIHI